MNKKKGWIITAIVLIIVAGSITGLILYQNSQQKDGGSGVEDGKSTAANEDSLVGDDRDEHGCTPSAGYTWCEPKQKCLRAWEEACEEEKEEDDNRILLTPENLKDYCDPTVNLDECSSEDFNMDPPSTTKSYENPTRGISVDLPYNPNWGSKNYRLMPYEEEGEYVWFGPMGQFEGGGWARPFWMLRFTEAKPAAEVAAELSGGDGYGPGGVEGEIVDINGFEVVQYQEIGLGEYYVMEVVGSKYNYRFTGASFGDSNVDVWSELNKIINSIELI